jgi:ADP-ribose pyrophosphatase YjhB (NUDIX family)
MSHPREYPDAPRVGVGAVILDGDRVLLVKRGAPPAQGKWSVPGGLLRLGETVEAAVVREVEEECGISVRLDGIVGVVNRIIPDADGRIRYHYVLIDYLAAPHGEEARAGSDATEIRWVPVAELDRCDTTEGLAAMVEQAVRLREGGTAR